jgi:hypothetical protein
MRYYVLCMRISNISIYVRTEMCTNNKFVSTLIKKPSNCQRNTRNLQTSSKWEVCLTSTAFNESQLNRPWGPTLEILQKSWQECLDTFLPHLLRVLLIDLNRIAQVVFNRVVLNYEAKSKRNERNETKRNEILRNATKYTKMRNETQRFILFVLTNGSSILYITILSWRMVHKSSYACISV